MLSEDLVEFNSHNAWRFCLHLVNPWFSWLFCYGPNCLCHPLSHAHTSLQVWVAPGHPCGAVPICATEVESILPYIFWRGRAWDKKGSKDLGSREALVLGDEATVGKSWRVDRSGSCQGSRVKGTQMGGWWKSSVSSLCSWTTEWGSWSFLWKLLLRGLCRAAWALLSL